MASRGASIPISVDSSDAISGLAKLDKATDKAADSMDDLGKSGKAAGTDLERGIVAGAKDAEQGVDKIVHQINADLDSIKLASSGAGDSIGSGVRKGAHEASEGVAEFRDEANSTAKEVAASFDGSAQSIAGGFQEIAANALAGFGPLGAALGLGVAAGIGLITKAWSDAKERAQEVAEQVAGVTGKLIELGKARLGPEQVIDTLKTMATTAEDGTIVLEDLRNKAKLAGIGWRDFALGSAGDSQALNRSYDEITRALDKVQAGQDELTARYGYYSDKSVQYRKDTTDQKVALLQARDALDRQRDTLDLARQAQKDFTDATRGATGATDDQSEATERAQSTHEAYVSSLEGMAEPATLYSEAMDKVRQAAEDAATAAGKTPEEIAKAGEAAVASLDDVLADLAAKVAERKNFEGNLAALARRGFNALADELRAGGPEANGAVVDLLAKGTDAQVQQYATDSGTLLGANLTKGAKAGVTAGSASLQESVNGVVQGITVPHLTIPVSADLGPAKAQIKQFADGSFSTYVAGIRVGLKGV